MTFSNFIKISLEQTGLTKYKLAKRLGISQTTVANWANGVTEPHDKLRFKVFDLFGVAENDLTLDNVVISYQKEKPPTQEGEGQMDSISMEALTLFRQLWPENRQHVIDIAQSLLKAQELTGGQPRSNS